MRTSITYLCVALIAFALYSCEESDRMSTDLIVVPATASSDGLENITNSILAFENDTLDFGIVAAGKRIKHSFKFTNTGNGDLLISNVHAPCGCTVAKSWPRQAIKPGESSFIEVEFDSSDRQGHQIKNIDIVTNARPSITHLTLIGDVIGPDFTTEEIK